MGCCDCLCTLLLLIVATLLPPLAVCCQMGCNRDLCFNLLLCLLGVVPGIIHAWYVVLFRDPINSYAPSTTVHLHQGAPLYNMQVF